MFTEGGGPAFPFQCKVMNPVPDDGEMHRVTYADATYAGMTLRDYFAAKAMQSLLVVWERSNGSFSDLTLTARSYEIADTMITVRSAKKEGE